LREFWRVQPYLRKAFEPRHGDKKIPIELLANHHAKHGFRFVPLVQREMSCTLDVLLLRRHEPNRVISGSGDLDGRVKTLIDGLRMPQQASEVPDGQPNADEDPFFCLLQDDRFIHHLHVTTDVLLVPATPAEEERDVFAVISVEVRTAAGFEIATFPPPFYPSHPSEDPPAASTA
jgi:hypothetical protein